MTFSDVFKKSFLEGYSNIQLGTTSILVAMLFALVLGLYIFFCYRIMTRRTFYSRSFNISLVCVTLVTSAIILTIQSSVVVSLGMVGALSIVRFRTAIKEPMDLIFLYWSISVGIICGAGLSEIAIILSLVMTVVIFALQHIPLGSMPMILIVNAASDPKIDGQIDRIVADRSRARKEKSRSITAGQLNLVYEIRMDAAQGSRLTQELSAIPEVTNVSLLSHDGEATF